jgi:SagB-type dehydrogenase family enzyme
VSRTRFETLAFPSEQDALVWELLHENSKTSPCDVPKPTRQVLARMEKLWESLPYEGYPIVDLPADLAPLDMSVGDAITSRQTARNVVPVSLALKSLATLLHCAYGVTRKNEGNVFPRPFRTVPSGGALYPLEIYFHSARVEGLRAGIYHYDAANHRLRVLSGHDATREISDGLVQRNLAVDCAAIFFITAVFERSVYKYGNRGYRFVFLEAGHAAQNLSLAATALGLGAVSIGGFFDRRMDELLGIDGLAHSTIYCVGVGAASGGGETEAE